MRLSIINCNHYDALFDEYNDYRFNKCHHNKGDWFSLDNESIAVLANEIGCDGVIFKNIKEGSLGNIRMDTTYIVFSSKQLKSPFENNGDFGDVEDIFK